jgi:hypothetical protein
MRCDNLAAGVKVACSGCRQAIIVPDAAAPSKWRPSVRPEPPVRSEPVEYQEPVEYEAPAEYPVDYSVPAARPGRYIPLIMTIVLMGAMALNIFTVFRFNAEFREWQAGVESRLQRLEDKSHR